MNSELISSRIRSLMKENKITQSELSKIIDKDQSQVSKYISGNVTPSLETLIQIAEYLKVPIQYFYKPEYDLNVTNIDSIKEPTPIYNIDKEVTLIENNKQLINSINELSKQLAQLISDNQRLYKEIIKCKENGL